MNKIFILAVSLAVTLGGLWAGQEFLGLIRPSPPLPRPAISQPPQPSASEAPAAPVSIEIPAINVSTRVVPVGQDSEGRMDVPKEINDVAWYRLGPAPGQSGSAVLAGHVDWYTGPAIFFHLKDLKIGDDIYAKDSSGQSWHFKVTQIAEYPDDSFPADAVFNDPAPTPSLNLITCTGKFDRATSNYSKRLVVFSELAK